MFSLQILPHQLLFAVVALAEISPTWIPDTQKGDLAGAVDICGGSLQVEALSLSTMVFLILNRMKANQIKVQNLTFPTAPSLAVPS